MSSKRLVSLVNKLTSRRKLTRKEKPALVPEFKGYRHRVSEEITPLAKGVNEELHQERQQNFLERQNPIKKKLKDSEVEQLEDSVNDRFNIEIE